MFDFQKILADARAKSDMGYGQFCKEAGIGEGHIRKYLSGKRTPTLRTADRILFNLGIVAEIGNADAEVVVKNVDDFPAVLRQQRRAAGMDIRELARVTLYNHESISRIESGKTKSPQLFTVEVLCETLGIKVKIGRANNER